MKDRISVSNLINVMKEQLEAYKELSKLAEEKTDVLVKGNIKLLEEITDIEQNMILKLGKLEEERFHLVNQIAKIYDKNVSQVKAEFLIEILDRAEAKTFSAMNEEFKAILPKIDEKNRRNEELIKNALEYINFSIKLLTDVGETKANYGADGTNTQKSFHFIDKKA